MSAAVAIAKPKIESIVPESEAHWHQLRARDITSTEISALFGISPYMTQFELWHRKKNQTIVQIDENERMRWGNRLEDAIARGIGEDNNWKVRRVNRYMRLPELRIGSSFDFEVSGQDSLLEIKNVDGLAFKEGWIEDGDEIEAPPHIEIQVQHQLAVSGKANSKIGALVGGNRIVLLPRLAQQDVIDAIYRVSKDFWDSIDANEEPNPNFVADAEFIARLYTATKGKIYNAENDSEMKAWVARYTELGQSIKNLEEQRSATKAQIIMKIQDAERVVGDGFSIAAGTIAETEVAAFKKKSFRMFRPTWKKSKETA